MQVIRVLLSVEPDLMLGAGPLLAHSQPGSDNYALAHEFVSGNLNPKYHRFRDANGKDVTRIYEAWVCHQCFFMCC
jgi:hypothetical protein